MPTVDPKALEAALAHAQQSSDFLGTGLGFDEVARELGFDAAALLKRVQAAGAGPLGVVEALPPQATSDASEGKHWSWSGRTLILARLLVDAGMGLRGPLEEAASMKTPESELYVRLGDLSVRGDLTLAGRTVIFGDLTVDGFLRVPMYAHVTILGSVKAGRYLYSDGFLAIGGGVSAPLVTLEYNQGQAKILGAVDGDVFSENDHGGTRVFGAMRARARVIDEAQIVGDSQSDEAAFRAVVVPELGDAVAAALEDRGNVGELLRERIDRGERVFAAK